MIQEWWGLDSYIKGVADDLAQEGFTALAPDLYHGELAKHTEMDKAAELMNTLPPDRSARDMGGAVDFLLGHEAVRGHSVGAVGFCMGGMLSMVLGAQQGDRIGAVVAYYGMPLAENEPDWSNYMVPTMVHVAGNDAFFPPDACESLGEKLRGMGKDVTVQDPTATAPPGTLPAQGPGDQTVHAGGAHTHYAFDIERGDFVGHGAIGIARARFTQRGQRAAGTHVVALRTADIAQPTLAAHRYACTETACSRSPKDVQGRPADRLRRRPARNAWRARPTAISIIARRRPARTAITSVGSSMRPRR